MKITNNKKYKELLKQKRTQSFSSKFALNKRLALIIPFIIITLLFVIIPLVIILIYSFTKQADANSVADNWGVLTGTIWIKIGKSFYISVVTTILCLVIGFPFTYFLSTSKSKTWKIIISVIISAPVWINVLIKLIGLKTIFDIIGGEINSTYGDIFTIIGLVYLYLPFTMIPLYNSLEILPKNLINASKDLGRGNVYTFFAVVIPWTKSALLSSIILVLLPAFTTVAVPSFLNNANDAGLIGDEIASAGESGLNNPISLARTSVLALVVSVIMFFMYASVIWIPKLVNIIKRRISRNEIKENT
ncbi:MAG: ABC transporter permease [Ureaplasma sp.]|nr:ABC transporter permease [Ureaplasma sp.]